MSRGWFGIALTETYIVGPEPERGVSVLLRVHPPWEGLAGLVEGEVLYDVDCLREGRVRTVEAKCIVDCSNLRHGE